MGNVVYFLADTAIEQRFERLLASKIRVEFMGTVNCFLGNHFEWSSHHGGAILFHLPQEAYSQNIVELYCLTDINFNLITTPYQYGFPIDATPSATIDEDDKVFVQRREM